MSYDLFVGLPDTRIIRKRELMPFYEGEQVEEILKEDVLPPAVRRFVAELSQDWPDLQEWDVEKDGENPRIAVYNFSPRSVYMNFGWPSASEAFTKTRRLAEKHQLLFFDPSSKNGDVLNAIDAGEQAIAAGIFTSEGLSTVNCIPADLDLLTDPDWFQTDVFFGMNFGDADEEIFMQTLNTGDAIVVEYRDGSAERHFRAKTGDISAMREVFELYLVRDKAFKARLDFSRIAVPPWKPTDQT